MRHNIQKWSGYAKILRSLCSKENQLEKNTNTSCDSCDEYQLCVEEETSFVVMSIPCLVTLSLYKLKRVSFVSVWRMIDMRDKYSHLICQYVDKMGELNLQVKLAVPYWTVKRVHSSPSKMFMPPCPAHFQLGR